jgi:hypothetical protein
MLSRCYQTEKKRTGKETGCVVSKSFLFVNATRDEFVYDPSLHNFISPKTPYTVHLLVAEGQNVPKTRRFWVTPGRTSAWWDNFMNGTVLEEEWKQNFRLSRASFFKLADMLRPYIEHQATHMRNPIPVEAQVAITSYYFSDEGKWLMHLEY